MPDADEFLRFMIGKLEPGGHLLVTVPNRDSKYRGVLLRKPGQASDTH